jgi:hypothetical protein
LLGCTATFLVVLLKSEKFPIVFGRQKNLSRVNFDPLAVLNIQAALVQRHHLNSNVFHDAYLRRLAVITHSVISILTMFFFSTFFWSALF